MDGLDLSRQPRSQEDAAFPPASPPARIIQAPRQDSASQAAEPRGGAGSPTSLDPWSLAQDSTLNAEDKRTFFFRGFLIQEMGSKGHARPGQRSRCTGKWIWKRLAAQTRGTQTLLHHLAFLQPSQRTKHTRGLWWRLPQRVPEYGESTQKGPRAQARRTLAQAGCASGSRTENQGP